MQALRQLDQEILFFLNHLGAEGPAREVVIRLLATGLMYALAAIVAYMFLTKPDGRQVLMTALAGALLGYAVGKIINAMVERDRPFVVFPDQVRHVALYVRPASFPSIHAASAFGGTGAVLFGRYRGWGVIMLVLAAFMIAARVAAGVHWPSDVAGGGLIGLVLAAVLVGIQRCCWPRLGLREGEDGEGVSPEAGHSRDDPGPSGGQGDSGP